LKTQRRTLDNEQGQTRGSFTGSQSGSLQAKHFVDARPIAATQRRMVQMAADSPQVSQLTARSEQFNAGAGGRSPVTQLEVLSTGKLDGHETNVNWKTRDLGGDTVGVEMEAFPLGPDHKQGTPPKSSAQNTLMSKLPTFVGYQAQHKYIRGHLLNDNVGGPGIDKNLFPITANANKEHESVIESKVKSWVNGDKQWVHYKVAVSGIKKSLNNKNVNNNFVDATLNCEASILDPTDLNKKTNTISASITSELGTVHSTDISNAKDKNIRHTVGTQAGGHTPLLSTSKRDKVNELNVNLFWVLKQLIDLGGSYTMEELFKRTEKIPGVGVGLLNFLNTEIVKLIQNDTGEITKTLSKTEQSNLTRLNNSAEEILEAIGEVVAQDFDDDTHDTIMGEF